MATLRLCATTCVLAWSATTPLFAQLQTPPRPPAPVYNGADIAAVNRTIERFGFDFVTVGAPGNRSWNESERVLPNGWTPNHINDRGRVEYEYRIMRTEVVQTQYVDFVRAFRPFWLSIQDIPGAIESGGDIDSSFTSLGISIFGGFDVDPRYDNSAVTLSWRNAARYANWLHHGAPTDEASLTWDTFHTGAYTFTDQSFASSTRGTPITRNEGARFWLPSLDELLKAAYYDPDRYGEGEEGYWLYPHSSNDQPVFGPPGEGEWGFPDDAPLWEQLASGRFPETESPWGVLDILGTASEWVETPYAIRQLSDGTFVLALGERLDLGNFFGSEIDDWSSDLEWFGTNAFRLATIVPNAGVSVVLGLGAVFAARRRR